MRPVLYALAFFSMLSLGAKAPIWEDSGKEQKRRPAQSDLKLPSIDRYLDMSCFELTDEKSDDEFVLYFSRVAKEFDDLCSLVKEDQEMDSDISQSERESIGLGTFSRLVEGHFNEFISHKKSLAYYQDLSCEALQSKTSSDKFISFIRDQIQKDGGDLCRVGLGTKSKVVEILFDAFNYLQ